MLVSDSEPRPARSRDLLGATRELVPGNRLLVPLIRGQAAGAMLRIGDAVAQRCPARGVVLSLVEIPQRWTALVSSAVVRSRELLRWIAANDYPTGVDNGRLGILSRFTADPPASIRESLLETQCDLVLAEWPNPAARRQYRLQAILRSLVSDHQSGLLVARPDPATQGGLQPRRVLAPLRGGPNAWLALSVASALADQARATLTLLHVYDRRHHPDLRRHEEALFHELTDAAASSHPRILEQASDDPVAAMFREGRRYDTVVLGAHANPARRGALLGTGLSRAMDELQQTVIVTRNSVGHPEAAA
jgi:nucleotide-binding universal stress UspA family protein